MAVQLVLIFADDATYQTALATLPGLGVAIRRQTDLFRTIAVTAPEAVVQALQTLPGLVNVVRDVPVRPACCDASFGVETGLGLYPEAQAGPQYSWEDFTILEPTAESFMRLPSGLTGECIRVAVIDTGVNSGHEALRGAVVRKIPISEGNPEDGVGHGTHVAGTIAGREVESPRGRWRGIAPGVRIININVLDNEGNGQISDVIAGLDAAVRCKVDLINMSLGAAVDFLIDPVANAVEEVTRRGMIVVAAAGNFGPNAFTIGTPGSVAKAVTVAAGSVPIPSYIEGALTADFSSRGPTLRSVYKPDVTAPGGAGGGGQRPQLIYGPSSGLLDTLIDGIADEWAPLRRTSMATPHITGLLALLMEKYKFTRGQLEQALTATARRHSACKDFEQGWGFIDGQALADWFEQRRLHR